MALYSRPRNTRLLVVSLVMVSLLTITVDYRGGQDGPFEVAGRGALQVVGTLQGAVSSVLHPIGAFFTGLFHLGSLRDENRRLLDQVAELKRLLQTRVSDQRIIQELTKLVKLRESLQLRGKAARVIADSPSNFEWSITIDVGSSQGIKQNMPVISGDGLVGHVVQVAPGFSTVQLIIDPASAVAGRLTSSGVTGLIVGQRSSPLRMDLVDVRADVAAGEQVVTAGFRGSRYPPEIPIGVVSHAYPAGGSLTTGIEIAPAVNFSALEFVEVITGP